MRLLSRSVVAILLLAASGPLFAAPAAALAIEHDGLQSARPGEWVAFDIRILNDEAAPVDIRLTAEETFTHQFSETEFRLYPTQSRELVFRLKVPDDAVPENHESFIQIYRKDVLNPMSEWLAGPSFSLVTEITVTPSPGSHGEPRDSNWPLAAIAAGGIAALLYRWRRRLWELILAPLLFRQRPSLAEQRTRKTILEALEAQPGLTTADLCTETGRQRGTVRYHLKLLQRNGAITEGPGGGWFPGAYKGPRLKRARLRVLSEVRATGIRSPTRLAERLGVSRGKVQYHLRKLSRAGLLPPPD